jgi:hypothetical protein
MDVVYPTTSIVLQEYTKIRNKIVNICYMGNLIESPLTIEEQDAKIEELRELSNMMYKLCTDESTKTEALYWDNSYDAYSKRHTRIYRQAWLPIPILCDAIHKTGPKIELKSNFSARIVENLLEILGPILKTHKNERYESWAEQIYLTDESRYPYLKKVADVDDTVPDRIKKCMIKYRSF